MARFKLALTGALLLALSSIAHAVNLCSITGTVYDSGGDPCANCTITYSPNGDQPQIVNGTAVNPTVVYDQTNASGVLGGKSLIQGTAMVVTIQSSEGISAPVQVAVPFNTGATFAQLLAQNYLTSGATTVNGLSVGTKAITTTDSPYTVVSTDFFINCNAASGAVTINLPASSGGGRWLHVKKTDSSANACTIARAGGDTIDGVATYALNFQYQGIFVNDTVSGAWSTQGNTHLSDVLVSKTACTLVASTWTCNAATANIGTLTLTGNQTIDISNPAPGQYFTLRITQDGTGGRVPTWGSEFFFPNIYAQPVVPISYANFTEYLPFQYDDTKAKWVLMGRPAVQQIAPNVQGAAAPSIGGLANDSAARVLPANTVTQLAYDNGGFLAPEGNGVYFFVDLEATGIEVCNYDTFTTLAVFRCNLGGSGLLATVWTAPVQIPAGQCHEFHMAWPTTGSYTVFDSHACYINPGNSGAAYSTWYYQYNFEIPQS